MLHNNLKYCFEVVDQFDYLEVTIRNMSEEQLAKSSKVVRILEKMMNSKVITRKTKIRVYRRCEAWTLGRKNVAKLDCNQISGE